jgi:ankyrin repeat protein
MQSQLASLDNARSMSSRLAASGAYAQRSTNASTPPLTAAAAAGDLVKTRALLDQGAAIDDRDATGRTPLMLAVGQNQIDTVRLLLTRGADPNAADQHGLTPLQLAQQSNFDEIAALLIKAGAH